MKVKNTAKEIRTARSRGVEIKINGELAAGV